jgi:hypothetical protein
MRTGGYLPICKSYRHQFPALGGGIVLSRSLENTLSGSGIEPLEDYDAKEGSNGSEMCPGTSLDKVLILQLSVAALLLAFEYKRYQGEK